MREISNSWSYAQVGARNSGQVSHVSGRTQLLEASFLSPGVDISGKKLLSGAKSDVEPRYSDNRHQLLN